MITEELNQYIKKLEANFSAISPARVAALEKLRVYVQQKKDKGEAINLTWICTHNSRRSHFSQVWAQVAAHYYKIPNVYSYSGGTEATALYYSSAKAMEKAGLVVAKLSQNENPFYAVKFDQDLPPIVCFSKVYDSIYNPQKNFAAILTCTSAEEKCPFIPNAEARIPLTFTDPKAYDGTPKQQDKYDEKCFEIATRIFYAFSLIK